MHEPSAVRLKAATMLYGDIATLKDNLTVLVVGSEDRFPLAFVVQEIVDDALPAVGHYELRIKKVSVSLAHILPSCKD